MNKKNHDIRVCSYCGKTEKNIVIFHCLILWHFDCSLDIFNFSLRGTKIHPKKTAFFRSIKSFIFLKYMPRLHLLPSRISKFSGPPTNKEGGGHPLSDSPLSSLRLTGMSSLRLLPKILHLLKNFLRTLCYMKM